LLGPAREVQTLRAVDLGKFRDPESVLRTIQHVHPRRHQRAQPFVQQIRRVGEAYRVVLLLPLADAQDDREVRPDRVAHAYGVRAGLRPYSRMNWADEKPTANAALLALMQPFRQSPRGGIQSRPDSSRITTMIRMRPTPLLG